MTASQIVFLVFGIVVTVALMLDLGLLSRKNKEMSMRAATIQTIFWVLLSMAFGGFIWYEIGREDTVRYLSAYLLEWSLSVDNIFVFIIIFSFFRVSKHNYSRVLLMGILMAIVFRIIFISIGSELVARFSWIMYIFGAFLLFTGIKMFKSGDEEAFDPEHSWAYRTMKKLFRTTNTEPNGRFFLRQDGKLYLTKLSMVVIMLGLIDVIFAVDSIPAVFSIIPDPNDKLLIYSSNIFAVLGLRSLFFLLHGASKKFDYLQQGIAIVLLFIGAKMLLKDWMHIPAWAALMVILVSIGGSVLYSVFQTGGKSKKSDS
jgi:tellurite resistance protein TerC